MPTQNVPTQNETRAPVQGSVDSGTVSGQSAKLKTDVGRVAEVSGEISDQIAVHVSSLLSDPKILKSSKSVVKVQPDQQE